MSNQANLFKLPPIVKYWLFFSSLVVFWDAGFIISRPYSLPGGSLNWIWKPYNLYSTIDFQYSPESFASHDGFPLAQSLQNLVENAINFSALLTNGSPISLVLGLIGTTMTFWKTCLYFLVDIVGGPNGFQHSGHNDMATWIQLYLVLDVTNIIDSKWTLDFDALYFHASLVYQTFDSVQGSFIQKDQLNFVEKRSS